MCGGHHHRRRGFRGYPNREQWVDRLQAYREHRGRRERNGRGYPDSQLRLRGKTNLTGSDQTRCDHSMPKRAHRQRRDFASDRS